MIFALFFQRALQLNHKDAVLWKGIVHGIHILFDCFSVYTVFVLSLWTHYFSANEN